MHTNICRKAYKILFYWPRIQHQQQKNQFFGHFLDLREETRDANWGSLFFPPSSFFSSFVLPGCPLDPSSPSSLLADTVLRFLLPASRSLDKPVCVCVCVCVWCMCQYTCCLWCAWRRLNKSVSFCCVFCVSVCVCCMNVAWCQKLRWPCITCHLCVTCVSAYPVTNLRVLHVYSIPVRVWFVCVICACVIFSCVICMYI